MTNLNTIQLKAITAIIEAIDGDDQKDAGTAIEMIKGLLGTASTTEKK